MEFELLHLPDLPGGPLEGLRRYLTNPRRQMQAWGDRAPASPGFLVVGLVALEFAVAHRLAHGGGLGPDLVAQTGLIIGVLLLATLAALTAGATVASLLEKPGRPWTAFCFLTLGLSPLLLWLPFSMLSEAMGWNPAAGMIVMIALAARVAVGWRDALQAAFKLSRLQTVLAGYGAAVTVGVAALAVVYAVVLSRVLSLLG
jgi:hypothetical protein